MNTYSFKVYDYPTHCNVKSKTLIGAIKCVCNGLSVKEDDILEIKKILRPITVEFTTKK